MSSILLNFIFNPELFQPPEGTPRAEPMMIFSQKEEEKEKEEFVFVSGRGTIPWSMGAYELAAPH